MVSTVCVGVVDGAERRLPLLLGYRGTVTEPFGRPGKGSLPAQMCSLGAHSLPQIVL